jgi:hypothetical protein
LKKEHSMTTLEVAAETTTDREAITAAVLDYIEGWYESRPERTERSLHPQLAKRRIASDEVSGEQTLQEMDAATLIGYVERKVGSPVPATQLKEIAILAVDGDIASVRAEMNDWIDLLQLGRFADGWKIVNVLWALKPKQEAA